MASPGCTALSLQLRQPLLLLLLVLPLLQADGTAAAPSSAQGGAGSGAGAFEGAGLGAGAGAGAAQILRLSDGRAMPQVALGTWLGWTYNETEAGRVRGAVAWALAAGYRHVDTAAAYGVEEYVGHGIADALSNTTGLTREHIFVTTKLRNEGHRGERVLDELRASLARLRLGYVDLYLVHTPIALQDDGSGGPADIDYVETWRGMEEARRLGLARSIGVSNFNASQLRRLHTLADVKPVVNQIEVNPTLTQHELVGACRELGVQVMAYSPFGFLVSRRRADGTPPPPPRHDDPALLAIAAKHNKTSHQVVLRYLVQRGLVVIPKSTSRARILQNIALFDFVLAPEDVATIDAFNKNIRYVDFSQWKDYPNYPFEK